MNTIYSVSVCVLCVCVCVSSLLSSLPARENLLARQTLEQNIVHPGATDLDVAMFHRDGGERTNTTVHTDAHSQPAAGTSSPVFAPSFGFFFFLFLIPYKCKGQAHITENDSTLTPPSPR